MRTLALALLSVSLMSAPAFARRTVKVWDISPSQSTLDASNPNGASGGRTNGLAVASDGTTMYAASEWGGLWRSADAGQTWSHVDGHAPQATWDVEVDPSNTSRVYATSLYDGRVASLSGISVSTDGGSTWSKPVTATPDAAFCTDVNRREQLAAFGIAIDPANSANVYVGTSCGLAISTDSGATWRFVDPTPADPADDVWDIVVHHNGTIDLCGDDQHQRSTDGGATWTTAAVVGVGTGRCSIAASPDERDVIFVVRGSTLRESDDGGLTWSVEFTNPRPIGRIPFVETNKRAGAGFDLWFGDGRLWSAGCTTPVNPVGAGLRCPTDAWTERQTGAHADVGALLFAPGVATDACPIVFSNDGGVYLNTVTTSPACHAPTWEQPTKTPHALWLFGMAGADHESPTQEDLYFGNQDTGTFATTDAPSATPTWSNRNCCDGFDMTAEPTRVVYTQCCAGGDRDNRIFVRNRGMTGGGQIPNYPSAFAVRGRFRFLDAIANFAADSYVVVMADGVYVTTNIGANPIVWAQLGAVTSPPSPVGVKVATAAGTPSFFVQELSGTGNTADNLWRHDGIAAGGAWAQINPPGGNGGFGIFAVDPRDPQRIIASHLRAGLDPQMVLTSDGGATWTTLTALDELMTRNGTFRYRNARGPTNFSTRGGYVQPTLVAFSPEHSNVIVAGGADSGVFISHDTGAHWMALTSLPPSPTHIPRPRFAYFDHEGAYLWMSRTNVYVGTQGRGVFRIDVAEQPKPIEAQCLATPRLCKVPDLGPGFLRFDCLGVPGCIVRDPIPKNCLLKFNCPGCGGGLALCPPWYHMSFEGLDLRTYDLAVLDKGGEIVDFDLRQDGKKVILSFRPTKDLFRQGSIGDYELVFTLRPGRKGTRVKLKTRLDVSDDPTGPRRAAAGSRK